MSLGIKLRKQKCFNTATKRPVSGCATKFDR